MRQKIQLKVHLLISPCEVTYLLWYRQVNIIYQSSFTAIFTFLFSEPVLCTAKYNESLKVAIGIRYIIY